MSLGMHSRMVISRRSQKEVQSCCPFASWKSPEPVLSNLHCTGMYATL